MSLESNLARPVSETMTPHVATLAATLAVPEAARILANNRVSGMPVVDEHGVVVGIVTLSDFVLVLGRDSAGGAAAPPRTDDTDALFYDSVRLVELMGDLLHTTNHGAHLTVLDIMSSRLVTIRLTEPTHVAARIMSERRVHRVLVVDDGGKLAGIVSALDIVGLLSQ